MTEPARAPADSSHGPPAGDPAGSAGSAVPELVALLLTTRSVQDFLTDLAGLAGSALTASCGITMRRDGQALTVASSDSLAEQVDEVQYGTGQGPCLQSLATGQVVDVPDLAAERRWDSYPAHAQAYGVSSSLSLPMITDGRTVGALNLYSRSAHAFADERDVSRALGFADQGAAVLSVALHQAQQAQLTEQLREALVARTAIDQAVGILMGQQRCNAAEAFSILRTASQTRNRKLRDIASDIVTSVGGPPAAPQPFTDPA